MRDPAPLGRPVIAAALMFAEAAILGYAFHRLAFSFVGESDPRTIGATEHIAYYWRAATAAWWGVLAGAAGWRWPALGPWAWRCFWPVVTVVVVIAFVVP